MANPTFTSGTTSVADTATLICTLSAATTDGALITNTGSVTVYLGGPSVTSSGATAGYPLAENATLTLGSTGGNPHDLYGITASSTAGVAFIFPSS